MWSAKTRATIQMYIISFDFASKQAQSYMRQGIEICQITGIGVHRKDFIWISNKKC